MKVLVKQYLSSLAERDELDAIFPDLLTQLGFQVQSRPKRGPRQYGVDTWALKTDEAGVKRVYLFSLKGGNLTRRDWNDGSPTAIKPSLDQILSVFVRTHLPKSLRDLPIVVCICFGGNSDEAVRLELTSYQDQLREQYANLDLSFEEWHGDKLTDFIVDAFMREELLPPEMRSSFRKALALVDEPSASITHFTNLIETIHGRATTVVKTRVTALRQMQICLWILFKWAGEAGNLEAPRHCSQLVTLRAWDLCRGSVGKAGKAHKVVAGLLSTAIDLQTRIAEAYIDRLAPAYGVPHGIGMAVGSATALDVNLKLFELVGRLGLHGLWLLHFSDRVPDKASAAATYLGQRLQRTLKFIADLIQNNPALKTPSKDEQTLDINLACLFLMSAGATGLVQEWVADMVGGASFAFIGHHAYPSMVRDYRSLIEHPKQRTDAYRKTVTASSIFYPTLAVWARLTGDRETSARLSEFAQTHLAHCSFQAWFPDEESDEKLFVKADDRHGMSNTDLTISADGVEPLKAIQEEVEADNRLSAVGPANYGLFPLVLQACRYGHVPSPPQYWLSFVKAPASVEDMDVDAGQSPSPTWGS